MKFDPSVPFRVALLLGAALFACAPAGDETISEERDRPVEEPASDAGGEAEENETADTPLVFAFGPAGKGLPVSLVRGAFDYPIMLPSNELDAIVRYHDRSPADGAAETSGAAEVHAGGRVTVDYITRRVGPGSLTPVAP